MPDGGSPSFERTPKLPESSAETPEARAAFESPAPSAERPAAPVPAPAPVPARGAAPTAVSAKDPVLKSVESVLEEGLGDTYAKMAPGLRKKFKMEGERVAGRIAEMVRKAKFKAVEALKLVTGWLKMIPGVQKFFLIQEAKIKTDKLMRL